jgi:hypothetical protein
MSTATAPPPGVRDRTTAPAPQGAGRVPIRVFLLRYSGTVLGLVTALVALQAGWHVLATGGWVDAHPWPAAVAAVAGWTLAVAGPLRRRGAPGALVPAVSWVAVLAVPGGPGWLTPTGLVLWGPVCAVLAVALAMAARPPVPVACDRAEPTARG